MKIQVFEDRTMDIKIDPGTQNENNIVEFEIEVPEKYKDYNKKIVFITEDGNIEEFINNNKYKLTRAITKYEKVKFYIQLIKGEDDFRTITTTMRFHPNVNADGEVTPEEINIVDSLINAVGEELEEIRNTESSINLAEQTRIENEARRIANEQVVQANEEQRENNEISRNTAEQTRIQNENARVEAETQRQQTFEETVGQIEDMTESYNTNAETKTTAFNENATLKTNDFNTNATEKTTDFNNNAVEKSNTFNNNVTTKINDFNTHVGTKTEEFDQHATEREQVLQSEINTLKKVIDSELEDGQVTDKDITVNDSAEYEGGIIEYGGDSFQATRSGKNKINHSKLIDGYLFDNNGTIGTTTMLGEEKTTDYIEIEPIKIYRFQVWGNIPTGSDSYFWYAYIFYDVNKNIITNRVSTHERNCTGDNIYFTANLSCDLSNVKYIRLSYRTYGNIKAQLEIGNATEYEEYGAMPSPEYPSPVEGVTGEQEITINNGLSLDDTLYQGETINFTLPDKYHKLPNGVKDTIEKIDGVWNRVQRVGKTVLNGTESMEMRTNLNNVKQVYILATTPNVVFDNQTKQMSNYGKYSYGTYNYGRIGNFAEAGYAKYICVSDDETLETFKGKLVENNLEIYYELAEPIYTPLSEELQTVFNKLEKLSMKYGTNHIFTTNANGIKPTLTLKYKKSGRINQGNINKTTDERLTAIEELLSTTATSAMLLDNMQTDLESEV